ncbi:uncharacterized protein JN550_004422 [Neoarthrinium moseri]|uniref:uncharacterized protein n=1 Tax=Neoarthrinium moseri TaxID=1658444 RepID=UPI001FDB52A8|nr:uncharacterized protein JN550_004422 [Neoarthrinium moseri]KAI1871428.1 hypothetical protein JN550_004422 [Neoarthrinium moseri]
MPPSISDQELLDAPRAIANPLHPDFVGRLDQDFIDYYNLRLSKAKPDNSAPIEKIRANRTRLRSPACRDYSRAACVEDISLESDDGHIFTARLYKPDPRSSPYGAGPYPVHVNFHGKCGGFTFGDLSSDASICMKLRSQLGILVVDIDYRLRPEHKAGKGHKDCWAAVQWVHKYGANINARPDSISIGGISAGGHIAAVVQQLARDAKISLKLAILGVPTVVSHAHYTTPTDSEFPSFVENENAPCLNWNRIMFYRERGMHEDADDESGSATLPEIYTNPLHGELEGVCDTFIATASADPLRDEGEVYGQRLIAAGVRTTARRYYGVPHNFMHMPIKKADMYLRDVCEALRSAHGVGFSNRSVNARKHMFQSIKQRRSAGAGASASTGGLAVRSWTWAPGKGRWRANGQTNG